VLHQGQTIYTRGYGHADEASHRRPDPQTIYRAGCCTNAFTATILSLLEQARRISFDGTFGSLSESFPEILDYNPNFADIFMDKIHLGDVLSHHTGLAAVPLAIRGINGNSKFLAQIPKSQPQTVIEQILPGVCPTSRMLAIMRSY